MKKWDKYFFNIVKETAKMSKDLNSKVGAVIVKDKRILSTGFNGMPRGIMETDASIKKLEDAKGSNEIDDKYFYYEHAERNAIYNATREGISLIGAIIYQDSMPCADCARGIIQSGIVMVKLRKPLDFEFGAKGKWVISCEAALKMLRVAGVQIEVVSD